ncbi:uncharacterized protein MONOS_4360 [Monocercomonoides exilis]|uniref:uncharacterized protein n=1 Tax=Monocercomonoides exilis TaxID=2049356 RepID=UPI00355A99EB|nr:hypothetical protein MONOS_4360 [Monocercomonoides exilis]|eukprot:MONOS_4360.1-p1 / transcript=MONOS_4360.1 / gene=MONOS_4360 / organism=Monocercomonoides_exilis_PA203 / gene_product=unspecified product / transcript_product=unspecified product / location=Mono_scaffold00115:38800-39733(+) / protein_length=234 / sequence_SO=supercontig / SO=protein_coding / is_pseudo=false
MEGSIGGFARIVGRGGFDHVIQDLCVMLGRKTSKTPHVLNLGEGKQLSRHHLTIFYDFISKSWKMRILGKNGAKVGFEGSMVHYSADAEPVILKHMTKIELCDFWFYFLLPQGGFDEANTSITESILEVCNKVILDHPTQNSDHQFIYDEIVKRVPWLGGGGKFPVLPQLIHFIVSKAHEKTNEGSEVKTESEPVHDANEGASSSESSTLPLESSSNQSIPVSAEPAPQESAT